MKRERPDANTPHAAHELAGSPALPQKDVGRANSCYVPHALVAQRGQVNAREQRFPVTEEHDSIMCWSLTSGSVMAIASSTRVERIADIPLYFARPVKPRESIGMRSSVPPPAT